MLPKSLLSYRARRGVIAPDYLGPHDEPWLRALLGEFRRFEGRPRRELELHLREPLPCPSPDAKRLAATEVLSRLCRDRGKYALSPRRVRAALFAAAASRPGDADAVRAEVAGELEVDVETLEGCLFADLPGERRIQAPPDSLSPLELGLRTNLWLAQGFVRRATELKLELTGNARAVVRLARLRGLITVVERAPSRSGDGVILRASGPLALFRRTLVYGRALASLVPVLSWCERFRLTATCLLDDGAVPIEVRSGDPIFPSGEPRRFDSRIEARFVRDFARAAPDWDVIREPEPIEVGAGLIFPDFALEHRRDRRRRWLLEIVGFWTPEYLEHKLRALRRADLHNLIVCVDAERNCSADDLPARGPVIRFRRKIDPRDVLAHIEAPEKDLTQHGRT